MNIYSWTHYRAIPPSQMLHSDSIWNFNLAQTKDKKELSSFPFMNVFVPTDMITGLYNFSSWLISIRDIDQKTLSWTLHKKQPQYWVH